MTKPTPRLGLCRDCMRAQREAGHNRCIDCQRAWHNRQEPEKQP
jgi:hypothetical protein